MPSDITFTLLLTAKWLEQRASPDGWMLDIWAARNEEPIHLTSTLPRITGVADIESVKKAIFIKMPYAWAGQLFSFYSMYTVCMA